MNTRENAWVRKSCLIGGIALLVIVSAYVRKHITTASPERLAETCREERLQADLPSIVLHDASGSETTTIKGTGLRFYTEVGRLITQDWLEGSCEGRITVLYDLQGNELVQFPLGAAFREFDANNQRIYLSGWSQSAAYDIEGNQIAVYEGSFLGVYDRFDVDSRRVVTRIRDLSESEQIQMYTVAGDEISSLEGRGVSLYSTDYPADNMPIVTEASDRQSSYIYDLSGHEIAEVKGVLIHVIENPKGSAKLLVFCVSGPLTDYDQLYLYTLSGEEIASFRGNYALSFELAGKQYIRTSYRGTNESGKFYDLAGNEVDRKVIRDLERASYSKNEAFTKTTESGQKIALENQQTIVNDAAGNQIATVTGTFVEMLETEQRLVTYSYKEKVSFLYELDSGRKLATLKGKLAASSSDEQLLLTTSVSEETSYLYDKDGRPISEHVGSAEIKAFFDLPPGFTSDNRYLLTKTEQNTTHIWPLK